MINLTHQDKLRITLKKGTTLFSLSNCDNIKVFLTSSYVKFPLNYQAIDGMLYCDIPSTIPAKTYGIDISGEKDGLPFSTKYNNIINVTEEPVTGDTENTYTSHNLTLSIGIEEECNSERTLALLRRIESLTNLLDELLDIQSTINTLKQQLAEALNGLLLKDVDIIEISNKLEETQSLLVNTWQQLLQVISLSDSSEWKLMYDDIIDLKDSELEIANGRIDSLILQILDLQEYAVLSVNDKTGVVALNAEDVGALPDNTELFDGNYNSLNNKPDLSIYQLKETGKGLSTNDYTNEDKYKLSLLEALINLINNKLDIINDLSSIRSGAALGATAILQEQDPTVPSWAKLPDKPTYTALEVGALPASTILPQGNDGKSAYEVWRDYTDGQGNQPNIDKTEEEFLASLKESNFTSVAVQSLPTEDIDTNKVYCVPDSGNNTWTEYIYDSINTQWISLVTHTGDLTSVVDGIEDLGLHIDGGNKVYWNGSAAKNTIVLTADRVNVGDVLTIDIDNTSAYSTQLDIYEDNAIAYSWKVTTGITKHYTYTVAADFTKMVISNSYRDMPSLSIVKHVDGIADDIAGNTANITSLSQRTATNENEIEDVNLQLNGGDKVYWDGEAAKNTTVLTAAQVSVGDIVIIEIDNTSERTVNVTFYEGETSVKTVSATTNTQKSDTFTITEDFTEAKLTGNFGIPDLRIYKSYIGVGGRNAANGYAGLDANGKVNPDVLPSAELNWKTIDLENYEPYVNLAYNGTSFASKDMWREYAIPLGNAKKIRIRNIADGTATTFKGTVRLVSDFPATLEDGATATTVKTITINGNATSADEDIPSGAKYAIFNLYGGGNSTVNTIDLVVSLYTSDTLMPGDIRYTDIIKYKNAKGFNPTLKPQWASTTSFVIPVTHRTYKISPKTNIYYVWFADEAPATNINPGDIPFCSSCKKKNYIMAGDSAYLIPPDDAKYLVLPRRDDIIISYGEPIDNEYIVSLQQGTGYTVRTIPELTNMVYTWWISPLVAKKGNIMAFAWTDNDLGIGVSIYNLSTKEFRRKTLYTKSWAGGSSSAPVNDDHDAPCVAFLPDGRLLVAHTCGHNVVKRLHVYITHVGENGITDLLNFDNPDVSISKSAEKGDRILTSSQVYQGSVVDMTINNTSEYPAQLDVYEHTNNSNDSYIVVSSITIPSNDTVTSSISISDKFEYIHVNDDSGFGDINNIDITIHSDRIMYEGVTCYAQYMLINNRNYIFIRDGEVNWSYIYSDDGSTWTAPKRFMVSDASNWLYYCLFKPILNQPNLVRVAMYPNPEDANAVSDIRLGIIDFSTGNVYSGNSTSSNDIIGNLNDADPIDNTDFETVIPCVDGKVYRLFDLAVTDLSTVRIAYAPFTWNELTFDVEYMVWNNGTPAKICDGGIPFWLPKYQGGVTFINQDEVVVGRNGEHNKDYIERYVLVNDVWKRKEIIYSEYLGNTPIRNIRPILASADTGTYIIWQRGMRFYRNFNDFDMSYCMLDVDKGVLYIQ